MSVGTENKLFMDIYLLVRKRQSPKVCSVASDELSTRANLFHIKERLPRHAERAQGASESSVCEITKHDELSISIIKHLPCAGKSY
jgi:hypothetical protein